MWCEQHASICGGGCTGDKRKGDGERANRIGNDDSDIEVRDAVVQVEGAARDALGLTTVPGPRVGVEEEPLGLEGGRVE